MNDKTARCILMVTNILIALSMIIGAWILFVHDLQMLLILGVYALGEILIKAINKAINKLKYGGN